MYVFSIDLCSSSWIEREGFFLLVDALHIKLAKLNTHFQHGNKLE